jgi:membrane-associated phospholipid phosphatase
MVVRAAALALSSVLLLAPATAARQTTAPEDVPLFGRSEALLVGGLLAAQIAVFTFDDDIRRVSARARSQASDDVASAFRPLGRKPPWYFASSAALVVGLAAGQERVADVGLHALLSLALANAVTGALKGLTGRSRPVVLDMQGADSVWVPRDSDEWGLFEGWQAGGPRQSWPSGHTTAAFAVASVLSEELGGVTPWIAYPLATGVAWSRVNDQAHWATDVLMGALVGTLAARLVVRFAHRGSAQGEDTVLLEDGPASGAVRLGLRIPVP